ncbi:MAG: putative arabinose efflux permease, family [Herbaspirillum sp.]|jgi:predicted MFS family arabinose efflux permease|nr:putative arabinose efflux permease, family [Herbaspirillum sp.]
MTNRTQQDAPIGLIRLMALMCGVSIASAYYAQPLLADIGRSFGVSESVAGALPMYAQFGIAVGSLLFLPLGDIVDERKLVLTMSLAHIATLILVALSPSMRSLIPAMALMGLSTITPYLLPAYAAKIVGPERRGHVTGQLARGIFAGILLARTASGYVGHYFKWNTIYWVASIAMLVMTWILSRRLPSTTPRSDLSYGALLRSLLTVFRTESQLRYAAVRQGLMFGAFNAFWISLVFLLEGPEFRMESDTAGLFGVVGVAGALAAPVFGKLADRRGPLYSVRLGTMLATLSWVVLAAFGHSLIGLVVGVLMLDLGVTASHVSNQTIIYQLGAEIRGRVSTIYILGLFIGGALLSGVTAMVWSHLGWYGVCALGAAATALAFVCSFSGEIAAKPQTAS